MNTSPIPHHLVLLQASEEIRFIHLSDWLCMAGFAFYVIWMLVVIPRGLLILGMSVHEVNLIWRSYIKMVWKISEVTRFAAVTLAQMLCQNQRGSAVTLIIFVSYKHDVWLAQAMNPDVTVCWELLTVQGHLNSLFPLNVSCSPEKSKQRN